MLDDFDAHKTIAEATENHEHALETGHRRAPHARWVPLAAALLAVVAAIATLLSNQSATDALSLKNEAIFTRTEASDSYNYYEAKSIKETIYEATLAASGTHGSAVEALRAVAEREKREKAPILAKARSQEEQSKILSERSERLARAHEIMEGGVTLLEVAIAIVSISALTSSTFLINFGALAALAGAGVFTFGFLAR